jgi:hypothetical protein
VHICTILGDEVLTHQRPQSGRPPIHSIDGRSLLMALATQTDLEDYAVLDMVYRRASSLRIDARRARRLPFCIDLPMPGANNSTCKPLDQAAASELRVCWQLQCLVDRLT